MCRVPPPDAPPSDPSLEGRVVCPRVGPVTLGLGRGVSGSGSSWLSERGRVKLRLLTVILESVLTLSTDVCKNNNFITEGTYL